MEKSLEELHFNVIEKHYQKFSKNEDKLLLALREVLKQQVELSANEMIDFFGKKYKYLHANITIGTDTRPNVITEHIQYITINLDTEFGVMPPIYVEFAIGTFPVDKISKAIIAAIDRELDRIEEHRNQIKKKP